MYENYSITFSNVRFQKKFQEFLTEKTLEHFPDFDDFFII